MYDVAKYEAQKSGIQATITQESEGDTLISVSESIDHRDDTVVIRVETSY
jgi:hypothetical protein